METGDRASGVFRPQERVQQHPVDQIVDAAPALPILDVPVPLMGWEVEVCISEPAILHEFRGEWEEMCRDNAVLLLGSGTLRFLMAGEDHEVVDAAPYWELRANASSDRTWCWRVFDRSAGKLRPEVCLQGDCPLLQCLSR